MSAPTTRDALAKGLARHRLHPSMNICKGCDWRATPGAGSLADQHEAHRADALLASGLFIDAATLADDEQVCDHLWDVLDAHGHNGIDCRPEKPMDYTITTVLRALAAALTERGQA